ncbi:hypothetical protein EDB19DRAFT_1909124 [Suillus lakei]|nr:hypothetical protein EDB19DRAFT_1909124 [Suillus lakei]
MPLSSSGLAPRFTGNPYELLTFLQIVHELGQDNGLPDKDLIKYALRYTVPEEREVWEFCDTCTGDNFTDFANEILGMYPCGEDRYYTRPANLPFSKTPDPTLRNPEPADSVVSKATLYAEIPEDIPASPDISTLDPKPLGDTTPGKPEISALDHPDIWDIDIEVLESKPKLRHPDISHNFHTPSTSGHDSEPWHNHPKVIRTSPEDRTPTPASPKLSTRGPAFPENTTPTPQKSIHVPSIRISPVLTTLAFKDRTHTV